MTERVIIVHRIYPPIQIRTFDYRATWLGDEPDDGGNMNAGYGKTPEEAIKDLWENFPCVRDINNRKEDQ